MRKKLNAAAGLVTIAAAGALIMTTPAYAEENLAPAGGASALSVPATSTPGQISLFAGTRTAVASDHHRRRHRRFHRRHHRRFHHRRFHHRHFHHRRFHHHRFHYWH